jgi:predicted Zn-dependent peptidase
LNIPKEEMTDEEWEQVDKADAEEDDYIEQLERLAELRDQGILTDEEFEAKKKQLLDL